MTDKYFTIVFKDLTQTERVALWDGHPDKISVSSYSHAVDDRDQLLEVLRYAESALSDIGDADREPGDDLEWCEGRAAEALPRIRELLRAHGKTTTTMITPSLDEIRKLVSFTQTSEGKWAVGDVHSSINGTVFGNIYGSVDGGVSGTIAGRQWSYVPSAKDLLIAAIRAGDTAKALTLIDEALPDD